MNILKVCLELLSNRVLLNGTHIRHDFVAHFANILAIFALGQIATPVNQGLAVFSRRGIIYVTRFLD